MVLKLIISKGHYSAKTKPMGVMILILSIHSDDALYLYQKS